MMNDKVEQPLIVKQVGEIVPININPEALIMKGIENNLPVESLERLLAMRETLKAEQAKEAFFMALAQFQADCPIIVKNKKVMQKNSNQVRYAYASLDSIISQISPLLKEHGLSYMFKSESREGAIIQSCEVHHYMGHVEVSSFTIPIDVDGYMGDAQKSGSASSYAKRYALTNAFGILTSDQDDDAQSLGGNQTPQDLYKKFSKHMAAVFDNIDIINTVKEFLLNDDLDGAAEAWAEIDHIDVISALSLAPTKGGCFTIEERRKMSSDDFKEMMSVHRADSGIKGL